jgi:DNA-binding response OmpR family regulator
MSARHWPLAQASWLPRVHRGSGPSGLAALDDATFDLMIVDACMPGMRGFAGRTNARRLE